MAGSLFITPALAFLSGPSTLQALSDTIATTQEYDASLTNSSAADLEQVLSRFTALTGSEYAQKYSLEKDLVALRTAKQSADEEMETLMKGALVSLSEHLTFMSNGSPLVLGAALTILQDEASLDDEGLIYFQRFPRIKPARFPKGLTPELHDVEDTTDPGEALKTKIPANLSPEDYREALGLAAPAEAIPIFTDSLQTPARRILALKYWYFSLNGDAVMNKDTANALLEIVMREDWGEFQEFAMRVIDNLLIKKFQLWIGFYFEKMWEFLSQQDFSQLKEDRIEPTKELVRQFGRGLYRYFDFLTGSSLQRFDYNQAVLWLLGLAEESYPKPLRKEGFFLATFILEDLYIKHGGPEMVHHRVKKMAATEKDLDFLYTIIDQHIWIGTPLTMRKVREILDIVSKRSDLTAEEKISFEILLKDDANDSVPEKVSARWSFLQNLWHRLWR